LTGADADKFTLAGNKLTFIAKAAAVVIRSGSAANVWNDDNNSMLVINSLIIFIDNKSP
jgi:hypothetical protein